MRIINIDLPQDMESISLYSLSDMHVGDLLFERAMFNEFSEHIREQPNRFIAVNGDIMNNNLLCSVGSAYEDVLSPGEQKKEVRRLLEPLADRIWLMTGGNHEARTKRKADIDLTEDIAEYLGVEYCEDEAFIKLSFGTRPNKKKQVYTIYMTHGAGGGKKPGGTLNNIEDLSKAIFADVYIVGHSHRRIGHKSIFRMPDLHNNNIREVEQLYVCAAGWLSYGGYPVRKMLRPQVRGSHPIVFNGNKKEAVTII